MTEVIEAVVADEGTKQDARGRKIREESYWEELIGQYYSSGLTQAQFARDWGGPELRELNEQRWEEVVHAELKRRDKTEADLSNDRKSVQWKRDLAVRLRTKTSASNPWIARRLNTGHPSYISKWLKETPKF